MLVVEAIYRRLVSHRDPLPALVDDHVSIRRDNVVDLPLPDQALEHRDVQPSRRDALATPICPIAFESMPRNIASWAIH